MRHVILLALFFSIIIVSCNTGAQQKFEFFYYPSRNVYYDVTNSLYLYSLDGGKTWDSFSQSNKQPAISGAKEIVYGTSHDIWLNNPQHIKQFNGHALNIMSEDSSTDLDLVGERQTKKTKPITSNTQQTQKTAHEKKPGFFKRLFGKKN